MDTSFFDALGFLLMAVFIIGIIDFLVQIIPMIVIFFEDHNHGALNVTKYDGATLKSYKSSFFRVFGIVFVLYTLVLFAYNLYSASSYAFYDGSMFLYSLFTSVLSSCLTLNYPVFIAALISVFIDNRKFETE